MSVLPIVLSIVDIVVSVGMIILFLLQEGNDNGMGALNGSTADSYYSKTKGRTLEEKLKTYTLICAVSFAVVSILLFLTTARGW